MAVLLALLSRSLLSRARVITCWDICGCIRPRKISEYRGRGNKWAWTAFKSAVCVVSSAVTCWLLSKVTTNCKLSYLCVPSEYTGLLIYYVQSSKSNQPVILTTVVIEERCIHNTGRNHWSTCKNKYRSDRPINLHLYIENENIFT